MIILVNFFNAIENIKNVKDIYEVTAACAPPTKDMAFPCTCNRRIVKEAKKAQIHKKYLSSVSTALRVISSNSTCNALMPLLYLDKSHVAMTQSPQHPNNG